MEFKGLQNSQTTRSLPLIESTEPKTGRFMSLSIMLHAALVTTAALMNVPPIEFPVKDLIEFEVENDTVAAQPIPDGKDVPESKGAAAPAPVAELPPAPAMKAAAIPVTPAAPPASAPKAVAVAPKAAVPATVDDIKTPDLETSETGEVPVAQMDEKDLQEDFDKIDQENSKALMAAKKSLDDDADQAAADSEESLKNIEKANQAKAAAVAKDEEDRRKKAQAAIAAAQARERAETDKAARLAAKEAADREGEGTGDSGSPEPTKEVAGIPGGVRSLEQLRQMPGNKFPQYSQDERLSRQEGQAVFYAYVNKDGSLSQFKLGQSTGFRNLDGKTLTALKKWKFYPGQEGWVEMPFKWTLNGEAMEAGGQLRK